LASQGLYPDAPPYPFVAGYEAAGKVIALGEGVDASWQDADVVVLTRFGAYSEQVSVPINQVLRMPKQLTYEEAATIPVAYLTAWMLLVVQGGLRAGETVLIHNAGSGVGLAAIDIARHLGAGMIIGTASASKHEFLTQTRHLTHAVDYRQPDWPERVREIVGERGVDLIIDPLGSDSWRKSYELLGLGGRLGMYGVSEMVRSGWFGWLWGVLKFFLRMPSYTPIPLMNQCRGVFGTNVLRMFADIPRAYSWATTILHGVEEGWVKPHVDRTFTFEQVEEAYQYILSRQSRGRVVLVPGRAKDTHTHEP
jgi:NADPH:quinone reductase-like Zn-dependent oxidoreductase